MDRDPKKWDARFLRLAQLIGSWSKDDSTKVGAIAIGNHAQVLAQGYNGFPRGVEDTPERMAVKDKKYRFTVHAEMNVICNANLNGVSLKGSTIYIVGLPPCHECSKALIQCGIEAIVLPQEYDSVPEPWLSSWKDSVQMLLESNVKVRVVDIWTE